MEIKVGEYVRTRYRGIAKIIDIDNFIWFDGAIAGERCIPSYYFSEEEFKNVVKKHSPNIIDLIEVGDIIKYKELFDNEMYGTKAKETYILNLKSQKEVNKFKKCVKDKDIEFISIVTKEQFAGMEYKV